MKITTYFVVAAEVLSLFFAPPFLPQTLAAVGVVLGFIGDIIFTVSVVTMKDSWRAGIAENDKTEIITNGIYSITSFANTTRRNVFVKNIRGRIQRL